MVWSNQIPPEIIILDDGTTLFTGSIQVEATNGSTAATISNEGQINGKLIYGDDIQFKASAVGRNVSTNGSPILDLATVVNNSPAGLIGLHRNAFDTFTVNNGTAALMFVTNQFSLFNGRSYRFSCSAMRGIISGQTVGTDLWLAQLVLYTSYPTSSNYNVILRGGIGSVLDNNTVLIDSSSQWVDFPAMEQTTAWGSDNPTCYLGLIIYRAAGTGSLYLNCGTAPNNAENGDTGPINLACVDLGAQVAGCNNSSGVYNPAGYQSSVPPAPATNHQQAFPAIWSQSYDGDSGGNAFYGGTQHMYQGDVDAAGGSNHGIQLSACNFDYATLAADLNGASNVTVYLNFYCEHTWYNSGMTYEIFSHNTHLGNAPGNSASISGRVMQFSGNVSSPGWLSILLPSNIVTSIINGQITGFGFNINSSDLSYYGFFAGATESNAPYIAAYWTK